MMRFAISRALLALLFALSFAAMFFSACESKTPEVASAKSARALVEQEGALLVDVRTPREYASGHIDGAVNMPLAELSSHLEELKQHEKVVVYCQVGARAADAAKLLKHEGIDVTNLGAMAAWYDQK